jgi:hypothetical protein
MVTSEQIDPIQKYDRLVIVSFVLGLMTIIFPILSILFLIAENGGPGDIYRVCFAALCNLLYYGVYLDITLFIWCCTLNICVLKMVRRSCSSGWAV